MWVCHIVYIACHLNSCYPYPFWASGDGWCIEYKQPRKLSDSASAITIGRWQKSCLCLYYRSYIFSFAGEYSMTITNYSCLLPPMIHDAIVSFNNVWAYPLPASVSMLRRCDTLKWLQIIWHGEYSCCVVFGWYCNILLTSSGCQRVSIYLRGRCNNNWPGLNIYYKVMCIVHVRVRGLFYTLYRDYSRVWLAHIVIPK